MILVDPRVGSKDLYPLLLQRQVPADLVTLPFGDVAFVGNGPSGHVTIGIERKRIRDLLQSLMSQRLQGHQLPGIVGSYEYAWVLVEGAWRSGEKSGGYVEVPGPRGWVVASPQVKAEALILWLLTLELRGGVKVVYTHGAAETGDWIAALYKWWTAKVWKDHRAHLALPPVPDQSLFLKPTLLRRVAAELPGIGYEKSQLVEQAFPSVQAMANAGEGVWLKIPGIGKTLTKRIREALQNLKTEV